MDALQVILVSSCTAGVSLYQPLSIQAHNLWNIFLQIADSLLQTLLLYASASPRCFWYDTCEQILFWVFFVLFSHNVCLLLACIATVQVGMYAADKIQRLERKKVPKSQTWAKAKILF